MNNKPWNTLWTNKEKNEFELYTTNNCNITLKKGSWIKISDIGEESNNKCIIDHVLRSRKNNNDIGPVGISYLPWLENENKFSDVSWSIKGNKRFIVCYPEGMRNYGRHINWDKIELCEPPTNTTDEQIQNVLNINY